jgi:hypothetical protein
MRWFGRRGAGRSASRDGSRARRSRRAVRRVDGVPAPPSSDASPIARHEPEGLGVVWSNADEEGDDGAEDGGAHGTDRASRVSRMRDGMMGGRASVEEGIARGMRRAATASLSVPPSSSTATSVMYGASSESLVPVCESPAATAIACSSARSIESARMRESATIASAAATPIPQPTSHTHAQTREAPRAASHIDLICSRGESQC